MNLQQFFQATKRFLAAVALAAFLLVGGMGLAPANTESQDAATSVASYGDGSRNGPFDDLPGTFVPLGNFWSG